MTSIRGMIRRVAGDERGFSLLELLVAMTMMTIGIGSLLTVFASSAVALHRSSQSGTALTLAESQMEVYRTVGFTDIRIDGTQIPSSSSDPYVTAHSSDSRIPPSTGQALGGADGDNSCTNATIPAACAPVQHVTGPDSRPYYVDTYVDYVNNDSSFSIRTPASGLTLKKVMVVVRDSTNQIVLAQITSVFQGP